MMRQVIGCVLLVAIAEAKDRSLNPEQIHIALAGKDANGNPTGMNVAWYTDGATQQSIVRYGLSANALNMNVTGNQREYYEHHGWHHDATLRNLKPGTMYYYQIGDAPHISDVLTFTSAPASNQEPFTVSIFGDMGYLGSKERPMVLDSHGLKKNWSAVPTRQRLEQLHNDGEFQMLWFVGDVGYADDAFAHDLIGDNYESAYNGFMNWFQNISSHVPYMVSPGNHESECHSPACVVDRSMGHKLSNFTAFNYRFHMPSDVSAGVQNMWYSWNYGPVHFVSANTETDFPGAPEEKKGDSGIYPAGGFGKDGEYMAWLEADLKKADEARKAGGPSARKFIVVGGHRPCCKETHGLQELLDKYEVDLYVSGHKHTYARSTAGCVGPTCTDVTNSTNTKIKYAYCGGTGSEETDFITHGPSPTPGAVSFATDELSSCLLTVVNHTTLQWKLVSSASGRIIDQFLIQ